MIDDGVANFFVHRTAAQRYAVARPYFHPIVMQRIVEVAQKVRDFVEN